MNKLNNLFRDRVRVREMIKIDYLRFEIIILKIVFQI
jgi:hypothetical protein